MTMTPRIGHDLDAVLSAIAPADLARVLSGLASAALPVANLIRWGGLSGAFDAPVGPGHDGVAQKALDVFADKAFVNGLKGVGVRGIVSEERDEPVALDDAGTLLVAIDPLDGSNNIDANVSIGTLFSVLDSAPGEVRARALSCNAASASAPRASSSMARIPTSCSQPAPGSMRRRSTRTATRSE